MTTTAEVRLWGSRIGTVALVDSASVASFAYDDAFLDSGIELAPLTMPLARTIYSFPNLPQASFHGLPGMLADALPDRYGNTLIDAWLATQGRTADSFNAVERLCYIGNRAMGALEFLPHLGPTSTRTDALRVDALVELASDILTHRHNLHESFAPGSHHDALRKILMVGTSAGGARAKAIIAWNPQTNDIRSGQIDAGEGYEYWLLKFDGVQNNRDKDLADPFGYGVVEYAYANMARAAGIIIPECKILEEGRRRHFMVKRFDRVDGYQKLHMQSLAAMSHFDFNDPRAYSYEQALFTMRRLRLPMEAFEQQFRRTVFNVVARNQDDHVKNTAFLMDRSGVWSLAPAFDLTWSFNPRGRWTSQHQMSVNGKRDHFTVDDLVACAATVSIGTRQSKAIIAEVVEVVKRWPEFAKDAGVTADWRSAIDSTLRIDL